MKPKKISTECRYKGGNGAACSFCERIRDATVPSRVVQDERKNFFSIDEVELIVCDFEHRRLKPVGAPLGLVEQIFHSAGR